ncbi:MAG: hypothetical protein VKL42_04640 [Snowella sp.]|nr:hypothetical protein [Snowella sp.]
MASLNPSVISQTTNNLIQDTEAKFKQIKDKNSSTLLDELQKAIGETDTLIKAIDSGLDKQSRPSFHLEFDDAINKIKKTLNNLVAKNEPVLDEINVLKQENETLGLRIQDKLAQFVQEPALSTLKTKVNDWIKTINNKLDEAISTSEENKKIDSRFEDIKGKLTELSSILELDGKVEALIQDIKTTWEMSLTPQEVTEFLQKINALVIAKISIAQVSEVNQRISNLISGTKVKIAGFTLELDREVQSELGKILKLVGKAQILLEERFYSNSESNNNAQKIRSFTLYSPKKEFYSSRIVQVKSVVDYLEIAIDALTGEPNLILSQKLRYASKERLRKIEGSHWFANWTNDISHAIKTPTKVLLGVVFALPLTWFLVNGVSVDPSMIGISRFPKIEISPIKNVLNSLPIPDYPTSEADKGKSTSLGNTRPIGTNNNSNPVLSFVIALLMTGTLGGAVSVLSRINEYDDPKTQKYEDDLLPFFIGLIKPILGGSFAFFIFLLLNSGVSPVQINGKDQGDSSYFYGLLAVAFIAGFSERFVPDLISQTEKKLVTPQSPKQTQGIPPSTLTLNPRTTKLVYGKTQTFTLSSALQFNDYEVALEPEKMGKYAIKTSSTFDYVAPTKEEAEGCKEVTITVTTKETLARTAKATITFSDV